jgi:hypothetical protein
MASPRPIYYIPIHGTWAIDDTEIAWWRSTGAFAQFARKNNVFQENTVNFPFVWSSDISGFKYNLSSGNRKHTDWRAAGYSLAYYVQNIPESDRNLIIHSHGLQPVAYAAMLGVEFNNVISVCSPIREDMMDTYEILRLRSKHWLHIYSNRDLIGWLGQFGDGRFLGSRKVDIPGVQNQLLKDINHTDVLKIGKRMDYWLTNGWFDFLRQ